MAARRPVNQRVAEIDEKIAALNATIATLEEKKSAILNPKPKATAKIVLNLAKKAGMKPDEILEKLGLTMED